MHFSRPSGQRLSWCLPWKRGAVGCFSNGYCSVTTFLNMVRKVTPKPATGSQNCSLRVFGSAIDPLLGAHHVVVVGGRRLGGDRRRNRLVAGRGPPELQWSRGSAHRTPDRHGRDGVAAGHHRCVGGRLSG